MGKSKAKIQREVEAKPAKNPKLPSFNDHARLLAAAINDVITNDQDPDRRNLAYRTLTRYCVLWTNQVVSDSPAEVRALALTFDTILLTSLLFPDGPPVNLEKYRL